jgi:hypothetical protein
MISTLKVLERVQLISTPGFLGTNYIDYFLFIDYLRFEQELGTINLGLGGRIRKIIDS